MSANGNNGGAQQLISLVPNKTYMVSFDLERGNYAPSVTADMTFSLNGIVNISGTLTTSASGHQSFMVTLPENAPAAQQLRFRLRQGNYNLWPHVFYVDNVTVTELSNNFTAGLQPDVVEYYDYDPFGMQIAKRFTQLGKYRYGFQGQEKDNELKGEGNSLNYTFRMHDPRVGRFFAVDPLTRKYPHYTPYSFSGNRVIDMGELEGLEPTPKTKAPFKGNVSSVLEVKTYKRGTDVPASFRFSRAAIHLLSLVSGVSKPTLRNTTVRFHDFGGGGLTTGDDSDNARIDYFGVSDDPLNYFMELSAHEIGHIPQLDDYGGNSHIARSIGAYVVEAMIHLDFEKAHDESPLEQEAEVGAGIYRDFTKFVDDNYGQINNGKKQTRLVEKLFNNKNNTQQDIIDRLNQWWKAYKTEKYEKIDYSDVPDQ